MAEPQRPRVVTSARQDRARDENRLAALAAKAFARFEDIVYFGLAVMLAIVAVMLLVDGAMALGNAVMAGEVPANVVRFLDRILLILMIVEILYTVQVSLREHALVPEPFLVIGLIAGIRRILVLTAEFSDLVTEGGEAFRNAMLELGLLTFMVLALVGSLVMLRRRSAAVAEKS